MTDITMRLDLLRGEMMKNDIDHYMIPSSDFHDSEYVGDYFKEREYMSGFNGSAGTLIVSIDSARLWTDGRYFLQAADQLEGSGIILMKQGEPGVPDIDEYLAQTMRFGETLGYDGRTVTVANSSKRSSAPRAYTSEQIWIWWIISGPTGLPFPQIPSGSWRRSTPDTVSSTSFRL